jgi:predicted nucleotidyltransferase
MPLPRESATEKHRAIPRLDSAPGFNYAFKVMPTTVDEAARYLNQETALRDARAEARAERLRARLVDAKHILIGYGAHRVFLFGSLATGRFGEQSDLDLAVEGLPALSYFAALADLMALFEAPVDLIRLEEAPETLLERIRLEGTEL